MKNITDCYPYLVILKNGEIKGYAYANKFVGRAAYDWSCELTIYLDSNEKGAASAKRFTKPCRTGSRPWAF